MQKNNVFRQTTIFIVVAMFVAAAVVGAFFGVIVSGDEGGQGAARADGCRESQAAFAPASELSVNGKSAYLVDYATGSVMYKKNENDRLPIASMVKIMTALLTLEAVDAGRLTLDEKVYVSEEAAGMGGSQIFLDAGTEHTASDLLKSVIVASANDSCVALAERISGSVGAFVKDMNARATELNMTNTRFANCTGLPAAESFSSAKDVSTMFCQLISHPKYFDYSGIWLEDYTHPDGRTTCMTNTNKLIRSYTGCDGGKTGFTGEAKFCLAATANKSGMRTVAVVIGSDGSKERFGAVSGLLDYAYANFTNKTLLASTDNLSDRIAVIGGKSESINLRPECNITAFAERGKDDGYEIVFDLPEKIKAPIKEGEAVGKIYLVKDGEVVKEYSAVAAESVERANLFDIIKRILSKW